MFRDRLDAERFFARIRAFDISCPNCGQIYQIGQGSRTLKTAWDSSTDRFACRKCKHTFVIAVLAYSPPAGVRRLPPDHTLSPRESLILRELQGTGFWAREELLDNKAEVNVVVRTSCTCRQVGTDDRPTTFVDGKCPVHGDWK